MVSKANEGSSRLAAALTALESDLGRLGQNTSPDTVAAALAAPVRDFDAAAEEVLSG